MCSGGRPGHLRVDRNGILAGRHQAKAGMVVVGCTRRRSGGRRLGGGSQTLDILNAAEALWELELVFQGFEVSLQERIVVGGVGPAVQLGDAEVAR